MGILHKDKKEFYGDYFLKLGLTQYLLFHFIVEFKSCLSDILNIKHEDLVDYIRFDCFLSGENSDRDTVKKIKLNNVTRNLIRLAISNSQGLVFAFSGLTTNSNRGRKDKALSRQSAYRWLIECHKAHYKENMRSHTAFSWDELRLMDTSTEDYLRIHQDLASVARKELERKVLSEIADLKFELYGDEKEFFKLRVRNLIRKAEAGNDKDLFFDVGYTSGEFIEHIESFFSESISWDNRNTWHIDHIKPINRFIDIGDYDLKAVNALKNLRVISKTCNLQRRREIY